MITAVRKQHSISTVLYISLSHDSFSHFGFLLTSGTVMGIKFFRSFLGTPWQFHRGKIVHTQKGCFPMGNSRLPMGQMSSVTATTVN